MNTATILRVQIPYPIIADDIEDTPWEAFIKRDVEVEDVEVEDVVEFDIYIPSGQVEGWQTGKSSSTNWKVVDDGIYIFLDTDGNEVLRKSHCYVPSVLSGMKYESDDYVMLDVSQTGIIHKWSDRQEMINKIKK
ncbi:hypothetical protein AGMMS49982_24380 [Bacteroidia bacterium]|nr:hypothetical protein AGMMS49982_24380 [Bacteroidia bacterium]